jgi:hypothetical protein
VELLKKTYSRFFCFVGLLICANSVHAQSFFYPDNFKARVVSTAEDIGGISIQNTTRGYATITDEEGFFEIRALAQDSLLLSGVSFEKKIFVVTKDHLEQQLVYIPLEEKITELQGVVLMPYNLSGDLSRDANSLGVQKVVTASTLGLPNANVKPLMQSERLLREAAMPKFNIGMLFSLPFNPIINEITGRTKMLKKRVARDKRYILSEQMRTFFPDSLYINRLGIREEKLSDFFYFCEIDEQFLPLAKSNNLLLIWDFLKEKSESYILNNKGVLVD